MAEIEVLITLQYLSTGTMQLWNSDELGPLQSTVSRV